MQASLVQLEEQISQYKQFDEDYQKRLATEKTALETAHKHEIEKVRNAALAEAKAERQKEAKDTLLILSKFLRAAAAKRQDGDEASEENKAFEGALLLVYGGDVNAVGAMEKLIEGSAEKVPSVDGQALDVTCEYKFTGGHAVICFLAHVPLQTKTSGIQLSNMHHRPILAKKHRQRRSLNPKLPHYLVNQLYPQVAIRPSCMQV